MMKYVLTVAFALAALSGCVNEKTNPQSASAGQTVAASSAANVAQGIWIDVRTPEEYGSGHLKNAVNIPVDNIAGQIAGVVPDKDEPVNLYCRSGRRAEQARKILTDMGYKNVTNHGGYEDLKSKGFE